MVNFLDGEVKDIAPCNLMTPEAEAVSHAVGEAMRRLQGWSASLPLYAGISQVPEPVLDLMAAELNTQYYGQGLPRKIKERIVSQALKWHMRAGTCLTLEEYLSTLYEGGRIEEWHMYGGEPYCFRAIVTVGGDERVELGEGDAARERIMAYKNVRSWLDALVFRLLFSYGVPVRHEGAITIRSGYYPRYNLGHLHLDGSWKLDGGKGLDGYDSSEPMDFYPCTLGMRAQAGEPADAASKICVRAGAGNAVGASAAVKFQACAKASTGKGERLRFSAGAKIHAGHEASMTEYRYVGHMDGTWKLDGGRKLDAQIIHHTL